MPKPTPTMHTNGSSQFHTQPQDLDAAIKALYNSTLVIYYNFEFVFKIIALLIIAFVMYKIGKFSVSEPIAQKVKKIQKQIAKFQQEKLGLSARIKSIKSFYNKLIVLFLIIAIAVGALYYTKNLPFHIQLTYLGPIFAIPLILYTAKLVHISSLSTKSKKFAQLENSLLFQTKQINKSLGSKVQSSLRALLCRQKISAKQNAPSHICTKKQCQQLRDLLKAKYEITKNLAECALQFQWCSTCKNRKVFDELVRFQAKPMPVRDEEVSEEEDAEMKMNYLLEVLEEIDKWVQDAGPCNCSKLYMEEIIKNKKNANRLLKDVNTHLQAHEKKRMVNATIIRTDSRMSSTSNISNISIASQGSQGSHISHTSALSGSSVTKVYYVKKQQ